ncbi:MAG: MerR family transcriptional regulator [Lachnospiraceae bacterium]|nr:MerR family transcriptional regulator [Lachnospiraceae bacterium]
MKYKYTIGEVQKQTGIAASALRFYDDIGLVKPSYTDENTGYRYYGYQEFWQLEIVKICKSVGISLKELKKVLSTNDPSRFVELMVKERDSAQRKLESMQNLVSGLNWMTERYEAIEGYQADTFTKKHIHERKVLSVEAQSDMDSDALHFALHSEAEEILNRRATIRREYGYELFADELLNDTIRWKKEFLLLEEQEATERSWYEVIPEGDYICFLCKPFCRDFDIGQILNKIREQFPGVIIERVYAMEAALFFYDWQDEVYEIQILIK